MLRSSTVLSDPDPVSCLVSHTCHGALPHVSGLRLLLGAVDLPVPAIGGQSPRLVRLHRQQGLVSGFWRRADSRNHWHVQVTGHRLIWARGIGRVKRKLLRPGGEVVARGGCVHVFLSIRRRRLRCARLYAAVVRHSARVIAATEVPIWQGGAGWVLGCRAGAALLHRLSYCGGGHLAGGVRRRAGCQGRGVRHQIPALVRSKVATRKTLHVLAHFVGTSAVVVEEHHGRVDPARTEQQWRCHSTASNIEASGSFLKSPQTERRRYCFPESEASLTRSRGRKGGSAIGSAAITWLWLCKEDGAHQPVQIIKWRKMRRSERTVIPPLYHWRSPSLVGKNKQHSSVYLVE